MDFRDFVFKELTMVFENGKEFGRLEACQKLVEMGHVDLTKKLYPDLFKKIYEFGKTTP